MGSDENKDLIGGHDAAELALLGRRTRSSISRPVTTQLSAGVRRLSRALDVAAGISEKIE
jgi:hypothetical protein